MTLDEAYKVLSVSPTSSKEEVSKAFKKLAALYHPDSSKNPDETKFKEINEAKQIIDNPPKVAPFNDFMHPQGWGSTIHQVHFSRPNFKRKFKHSNVILDVHLVFNEAVLGAKKQISYDKYEKCDHCSARGVLLGANICGKCNGKGSSARQQGHVNVITECAECRGSGKELTSCSKCSGEGIQKQFLQHNIELPYGVRDGQMIRISGAGHYQGSTSGIFGVQDVYGDVFIKISVEPDPDMSLDESGQNVVSSIKLKLIDALKGINVKVKTIKGQLTLKVPSGSKNGQHIVAKGYGAGHIGHHIFILEIDYPEDTSKLIEFLEKQET